MQSYLFYDLETSGLNPAFDQVLHFAAIRTDASFRELKRHEMRIRLRPDVLMAPGALITHRIPLESLGEGDGEYEAICLIHGLLNSPGTVSLGYNSLNFDDIFLRFAFYRNLLPAYTHQFAGGCSRMDIFPLTVFFHLFRPEVLRWPEEQGRVSLRLENLSRENQLAQGMAHDAMVDVEATLALARVLASEKEMWAYLLAGFDKKSDGLRLEKLPEAFRSPLGIHPYGLLCGPEMRSTSGYQAPVLGLGRSAAYTNQTLWLRLDGETLQDTNPLHPEATTSVVRKRNGESPFILPPATRFWEKMGREKQQLAEENMAWLRSRPDVLKSLCSYYRNYRYPDIEGLDPDAALYQNGFLSKAEEALCRRFHGEGVKEKAAMLTEFPPSLQVLAARLLYRNGLDNDNAMVREAGAAQREYLLESQQDRIPRDWRGEPRRTVPMVLQEITGLREKGGLDAEQMQLLDSLEGDLRRRFSCAV